MKILFRPDWPYSESLFRAAFAWFAGRFPAMLKCKVKVLVWYDPELECPASTSGRFLQRDGVVLLRIGPFSPGVKMTPTEALFSFFHELIHVKQLALGELVCDHDKGGVEFHGRFYPAKYIHDFKNSTECDQVPWEQEAYGFENKQAENFFLETGRAAMLRGITRLSSEEAKAMAIANGTIKRR